MSATSPPEPRSGPPAATGDDARGPVRTWKVWVCEACDAIEQREENEDPYHCNGVLGPGAAESHRHRMQPMKAVVVVRLDEMLRAACPNTAPWVLEAVVAEHEGRPPKGKGA